MTTPELQSPGDETTSSSSTSISPVYPDGTAIEWHGNPAHLYGILHDTDKFYKRTGHFQKNSLPYSERINEHVTNAVSIEGVNTTASPLYPELVKPCQERIGALMYLTTSTRCDITYPTYLLARTMSRPTPEIMAEIDHILCYLVRTKHIGLTYDRGSSKLTAYSDASWEVKNSTSGWACLWHGAVINWGSRKQHCVALSSCEAEIIALSETAKDVVYLRKLVSGIDKSHGLLPTKINTDSQSARDLAYNAEHHEKTKHVLRRHFYVRDMVEKFEVTVPFVAGVKNIADFFTKPLKAKPFYAMRAILMNEPGRARDE